MRLARRLVPLLLCALLAGVPAVAMAQGGAGDDQYQDPFAGSGSGGGNSGPADSGGSGQSGSGSDGAQDSGSSQDPAPAPAPDPAPATSSPAPATPAAPAASSAAPVTGARAELPRTGLDVRFVALLGLGLLAAGVGLRLRAGDGRRP